MDDLNEVFILGIVLGVADTVSRPELRQLALVPVAEDMHELEGVKGVNPLSISLRSNG